MGKLGKGVTVYIHYNDKCVEGVIVNGTTKNLYKVLTKYGILEVKVSQMCNGCDLKN